MSQNNHSVNESFLNIQPSPSALVQALRDIGYSMESAVADVIDNSITAGANMINVRFAWNNAQPWFAIIDNGKGMTSAEMTDAMRLGYRNPLEDRDDNDLGRFGLGMKTASFSQCCKLTLISKQEGYLACREWDLDLIEQNPADGWRLRVLEEDKIKQDKQILNLLPFISKQGTIVLWRKLDRYDELESKLNTLVDQTRTHLALVFHRFLSPGGGKKRLRILINNDPVEAFNPFNQAHPATQELPEQKIQVEGQAITVQPYILPHFNKTSKVEYRKYAGLGGYLQNQGFYVYRNRRLIIKGTWFRLIKKEELTKLIRVQIDIPNSLDHLWKIDVKKSHASPPENIRNELKQVIDKIGLAGKRVYRQRGQKLASTVKTPAWNRVAAEGKIFYEINRNHPLLLKFQEQILDKQLQDFRDLITILETSFPVELFYSDLANKPETMEKPVFDKEHFSNLLDNFISQMLDSAIPQNEIVNRLLSIDPFASHPEEIKNLFSQKGYPYEGQ